jgi:uncharacterized protein (DUF924 family)
MSDLSAGDVLTFWFEEAGPEKWYKKDEGFDRLITDRFSSLIDSFASEIEKSGQALWEGDPAGDLATVITLDQFPRNIYRNSAKAFAFDPLALAVAKRAIAKGRDVEMPKGPRSFFYMPFMHSEDLADQEMCIHYMETRMGDADSVKYAVLHRDIIRDFGRFPHRNEMLGRSTTKEEQGFLDSGGFAG